MVLWSCHPLKYQLPNKWGYGAWNNWEKEEGSSKEIMGRVCKEGCGVKWLVKRGYVQLIEMARAN